MAHFRMPTLSLLLLCLLPTLALAQAPCTHWASSQGQGSTCEKDQPCRIASWWPLAGPGKTLCLLDGTYTGGQSLILPPATVRGTATAPVTIRAVNDGQVLLDAQHTGWAISLYSNEYVHIEGLNATNGLESLISLGGKHNRIRRTIGWDGKSGEQNSYIWYVWGIDSIAEDCAGWGMNSRKVMNGSQSGNIGGSGFRRCFGEWNDHPMGSSDPHETFIMGYNTTNQTYENIIGTWNTRGQTVGSAQEGVLSSMRGFDGVAAGTYDMEGSRVLGSIFYAPPGANYPNVGGLVGALEVTNLRYVDVAAVLAPTFTQVAPFYFSNANCGHGKPLCTGNVCQNCLAVHAGTPVYNEPGAGWTTPGLRQGKGLEAATGGTSAFELLPGICKRYVGGTLTTEPLWPWPMNDRIKAARLLSGAPVVDVTAQIEAILGPIPAACRGGGVAAGDTTPPQIVLTAPSHEALVSGTAVAVSAEASDNVGVVSIRFLLDGVPVGKEECCTSVHVLADSTTVANGLHKLKAIARDAAGNERESGTIDVTIFNSAAPVPPPSTHPPLACSGELGAQGRLTMACVPQPEGPPSRKDVQ